MHAGWIKTFAAAVVLIGAGLAFGQAGPGEARKDADKADQKQPGDKAGKDAPPKTKLEEMLQQALRNNPDIRVAEAKVAEAESELNRTRQVVVQKIVTYQANLDLAKAVVAEAEQRLKAMVDANKKVARTYSPEDVAGAELLLLTKKAELAKLEAELPLLLGDKAHDKATEKGLEFLRRVSLDLYGEPNRWKEAAQEIDRAVLEKWIEEGNKDLASYWAAKALLQVGAKPPVQGPMADRIKKALDKPIKVDFPNLEARSALESLLERVGDVPYNIRLNNTELGEMINLKLGHEVPLGAALQAFQDVCPPSVRFVVRDYGILVTDDKHVPPGATLLYDLWKGGQEKAKTDKPGDRSEAPAKVEGTITRVDPKAGAATVSVGSDAGLKVGDMLHVYRLGTAKDPGPKYIGQMSIVALKANEAVCELTPILRLKDVVLAVGDSVTNVIPEK